MLLYTLSGVFRESLHLSYKRIAEQNPGANHTDSQTKSVSGKQNKGQVQRPRKEHIQVEGRQKF